MILHHHLIIYVYDCLISISLFISIPQFIYFLILNVLFIFLSLMFCRLLSFFCFYVCLSSLNPLRWGLYICSGKGAVTERQFPLWFTNKGGENQSTFCPNQTCTGIFKNILKTSICFVKRSLTIFWTIRLYIVYQKRFCFAVDFSDTAYIF